MTIVDGKQWLESFQILVLQTFQQLAIGNQLKDGQRDSPVNCQLLIALFGYNKILLASEIYFISISSFTLCACHKWRRW